MVIRDSQAWDCAHTHVIHQLNRKTDGVEELVGASFGGLTSIFNGKAWPKAMQAFRMVVSALLYDFVEEGENTHEQMNE